MLHILLHQPHRCNCLVPAQHQHSTCSTAMCFVAVSADGGGCPYTISAERMYDVPALLGVISPLCTCNHGCVSHTPIIIVTSRGICTSSAWHVGYLKNVSTGRCDLCLVHSATTALHLLVICCWMLSNCKLTENRVVCCVVYHHVACFDMLLCFTCSVATNLLEFSSSSGFFVCLFVDLSLGLMPGILHMIGLGG